ncbi:hypothetical protein A4D02_34240 [Niastella koreensis]|uniref:Lipoprotein n=2 Tax=Niastella koreensis TaxID=354356 RepID=G8TDD7_NIAKG|nr:hypothetical protein [Niastella koreensis]AEV99377.1 hypothetical protein Niako_3047 [Niastella koreensis GR20-10]OQP45230.1 hypothetical protein A4D02_34240 [Niastella koreensis]
MIKQALVIFLLFGSSCTSQISDCFNDKDFQRFDSLLTKGIYTDTLVNHYINDNRYLMPLRQELCAHVSDYNHITYIEMISFINQRRTGLVYLHDRKKFFSFSQEKLNATLNFWKGVDTDGPLYKLMKEFEQDNKWDADKLQNAYSKAKGMSAPAIKYIRINDTSVSSFTIAYDPKGHVK